MPLDSLWKLEKAFSEGNEAAANEALCDYLEGKLDSIEAAVASRFPARRRFVEAALAAHRRHEYALSIPLLLAQTDGICKDITDEHFFIGKDKRPGTAPYVARVAAANGFQAALLSPLAETLPISQRANRSDDFDGLNRHLVLHGESLDYDTRTNSFKAISLIHFVARALREEPVEERQEA
jgi:hypothetical protein